MLASATDVYTVVYILLGVMGLGGAGGAIGFFKWAKAQGIRDEQLSRVISVVLPDSKGNGGLVNRLDAQDRKLEEIARETRPNGGGTQRLGDTVKRTETKVDALNTKLDQHIGKENEINRQHEARLSSLEGK